MSLEKSFGRHRDQFTNQDRFVSIDADATLKVNEQVAHVSGFSAAVAVTLPPVAQASGQIYVINVTEDASTNNITVQDQDESRDWADIVIDQAAGATVVLYSTGDEWLIISFKGATKLTDSSGGTADGTVAAVTGSGADATINNNFADLAAKINEILELLGQ